MLFHFTEMQQFFIVNKKMIFDHFFIMCPSCGARYLLNYSAWAKPYPIGDRIAQCKRLKPLAELPCESCKILHCYDCLCESNLICINCISAQIPLGFDEVSHILGYLFPRCPILQNGASRETRSQRAERERALEAKRDALKCFRRSR